MSTRSVLCPRRARQAARLMLVVVFPQPPFWLMIAMVRMAYLPWSDRRGVCRRPAPREKPIRRPAALISDSETVGVARVKSVFGELRLGALVLWDRGRGKGRRRRRLLY